MTSQRVTRSAIGDTVHHALVFGRNPARDMSVPDRNRAPLSSVKTNTNPTNPTNPTNKPLSPKLPTPRDRKRTHAKTRRGSPKTPPGAPDIDMYKYSKHARQIMANAAAIHAAELVAATFGV